MQMRQQQVWIGRYRGAQALLFALLAGEELRVEERGLPAKQRFESVFNKEKIFVCFARLLRSASYKLF